MNPASAFAAGSGVSANQVALLVVGVTCALLLLWTGWALLSVYLGWAKTRVDTQTAQRAAVRIVLLTVVILWIVLTNL